MYIRFVRPNRFPGLAAREGFLCAAYELRYARALDAVASAQLEEFLAWFRTNLTIPKRFNRTRSKGHKQREMTAGLSWFREDATEMVEKSFELIAFLNQNGYLIDVLHTARVGYIIYEDKHQVVAEPFSDTPT